MLSKRVWHMFRTQHIAILPQQNGRSLRCQRPTISFVTPGAFTWMLQMNRAQTPHPACSFTFDCATESLAPDTR